MNGPQQQVAIEVALTTLAFTLPISSLPSPDLTSEQIVASDRELGLAESQQQRSSTHSRGSGSGYTKAPILAAPEKRSRTSHFHLVLAPTGSSSHPSPRATMIRPPQLIAHSSQGKRAPTPCHDRAGLGRVPVRRISLIFDRDPRERGSWQAGTVYLLIGALLSCCGEYCCGSRQ